MTILTVFNIDNQSIRFERRGDRVWGCLNDIAKATGKCLDEYWKSKPVLTYVISLSDSMGIPVEYLVIADKSNDTWAIEEILIDFAPWCDAKLEVWIYQQINAIRMYSRLLDEREL